MAFFHKHTHLAVVTTALLMLVGCGDGNNVQSEVTESAEISVENLNSRSQDFDFDRVGCKIYPDGELEIWGANLSSRTFDNGDDDDIEGFEVEEFFYIADDSGAFESGDVEELGDSRSDRFRISSDRLGTHEILNDNDVRCLIRYTADRDGNELDVEVECREIGNSFSNSGLEIEMQIRCDKSDQTDFDSVLPFLRD